jgi:hypothetical protein
MPHPSNNQTKQNLLPPQTKTKYDKLKTAMPLARTPAGFGLDIYYQGGGGSDKGLINNARSLAVSKNSKWPGGPIIVYASSKMAKRVYALVDLDGDGRADSLTEIARGLDKPQGMDWYNGDLYVSGWSGPDGMIWRLKDVDKYALQGKVRGRHDGVCCDV